MSRFQLIPPGTPSERALWVIAPVAGLLVVLTTRLLSDGIFVFPAIAGVITLALAWRAGSRVADSLQLAVITVFASALWVLPMIALVVTGAYALNSLAS